MKMALLTATSVATALMFVLPAAAHDCPPGWTPVTAGPAVGGPNRRTLSPAGYGAATGEFSRLGPMKLNLTNNNQNRNKPTFYLGANIQGLGEVDAGAQYEPLDLDNLDAGWHIYMANSVYGCFKWNQPTVNNAGSVEDVVIEFTVSRDGVAHVTMGEFPAVTTNLREVTKGPLDVTKIRMKRVIGLTQQRGFKVDGSYYLKTQFSQGQVRPWKKTKAGKWVLGPYQDWPVVGSNTVNTQPGKNATGVRYIDCEQPWKRLPNGADQSPTAHTPNRFVQETVNIDLRGKIINARKLQTGKQSPAKTNP